MITATSEVKFNEIHYIRVAFEHIRAPENHFLLDEEPHNCNRLTDLGKIEESI